tara:strand:- start:615 stop:827 length:213 start_codon:yes stop_codon:yes gene_type:complete
MTRKKELLMMLDRVNNALNVELDLNNAPIYGGWQLTNKESSNIVKHRVSIKEMLCFLDGMVKSLEMKETI